MVTSWYAVHMLTMQRDWNIFSGQNVNKWSKYAQYYIIGVGTGGGGGGGGWGGG